ncbi:MAG: VWA domain-containing protein [Candidatus Scalindua sediminis]|nr:VWA domain-containing protein [Candidatus Scalindua sediminis]
MEYQFTSPDFLKLLYILPAFWVTAIMGFRRLSFLRILLSIFLRTFVFLLVVFVLAGFSWNEKSKNEISAVFLLDMSGSINQEGKKWMWDYVRDVEKNLDKKTKKGLVVFGGESKVVTPTLVEDLKLDDIHEKITDSNINPDRTDVASGIIATLGIIPEDSSKIVILLSDGNENLGDALKSATMAAKNDVKIFVAAPPDSKENEILVKKITVPKEVNEGEMFNVKVVIENKNDKAIGGNLKLYQRDNLLKEWDTEFRSGISVFEVPYKSEEKGFVKFVTNLNVKDTASDKDESNNSKTTFVNVSGKARILYVNGAKLQRTFLPEALKDKTITVDIKNPDQIPRSLQEYLKYDCLIFSNVSKDFLDNEQMNLIKKYVKDFGGGFVMTSGNNIYAKDGYSNTAIEEILPVKIIGGEPPKKEKRTRLSLILIIDKSGSMLGKKMLFAKKASIELIKQLEENDKFGIVAFDTRPYSIVDLKPVGEVKKEIIRKLSMLNADGGTDIFPAMGIAYDQLVKSGAKKTHVILLSDGNTRSVYYYYNALMSRFQQANITVSTVALGSWLVNTKLLKDIAKKTKGQFYQITDIIKLPRLVIQDSDIFVSQSDFHEEHFYPRINQKSQILKGIYEKQFPPLKGYTITEAKEKAEVPLVTDIMGKTDPILANWRYGLGKVVIYTPDADARWSSKWINWLKFNKFWSQVVRWSMKDISKTDYNLKVQVENNTVSLLIESSTRFEDDTKLKISLLTPELDNDSQELILKQIAPQRFTAELRDINPGAYTVKISRIKDEKVVDLKTKGLIVPGSTIAKPLEYSDHGNNVSLLKNIAEITGGKYNPSKEEMVVEEKETTRTRDLASYLIPMAMVLFIFDIAIRKFNRQNV